MKEWWSGAHSVFENGSEKVSALIFSLMSESWAKLKKLMSVEHVGHIQTIHNFFQGQPNPGFRPVKVQTETFFKKDSQDLKNSFYLVFLWIPSKPGKQN